MSIDKKPNIIFLDLDGVLNSSTFFSGSMRKIKKELIKKVKSDEIKKLDYYKSQISSELIEKFNKLCADTNADVVVSASFRQGKDIETLQEIFDYAGGTFRVISKTERLGYERGIEISKWIKDNVNEETYGCKFYDFVNYAIIDDNSDMLLNQRHHFFQTDNFVGLTDTLCYKINRFFKTYTK